MLVAINHLNKMYCKKCGVKLEGDVKFCGSCGAQIESATNRKGISQDGAVVENSAGSHLKYGVKKIAGIAGGIIAFFVLYFLITTLFHFATNSSGDDAFMTSFKSSFMQFCEAKAGASAVAYSYCTCTENYLATNNSESQLQALVTQVESGQSQMPQEMTNAINACS